MSAVSRATDSGRADPADATPGRKRGGRSRKNTVPVDVTLMHGRWRHFGWMVFCLALGGLLVIKLDTIGRAIGLLLAGAGVWQGVKFVRTLVFPAGTISVTAERVVLPLGLCRPGAHAVPAAEVKGAFFLRRAVPFLQSGPVLVIEIGDEAFLYPRDWFARESDQRRIAQGINDLSKSAAA